MQLLAVSGGARTVSGEIKEGGLLLSTVELCTMPQQCSQVATAVCAAAVVGSFAVQDTYQQMNVGRRLTCVCC